MSFHPPKYALKFLRWFCREEFLEEIEGDLQELFEARAKTSLSYAKRRYFWDILRAFHPVNFKSLTINNPTMTAFQNYTKIYFRRFRKEKIHYLVNTFGLALGLMIFAYVLLYVHHEYQVDAFHGKSERIYRVIERSKTADGITQYASVANPFAVALKEEFPEVEATAPMVYFGSSTFRVGEKQIADRNYAITTNSIFNIWDIKVLQGDPFKIPQQEVGLVITDEFARLLFGDEDPVGQVVENRFGNSEVLAVIDKLSPLSTYQPSIFFVTDFKWGERYQQFFESWDSHFMTTWVLLKSGARPSQILANKGQFLDKYLPEDIRAEHDFYFQNIGDIHLKSTQIATQEMEPPKAIAYSSEQFVWIILLIGFLVIFIAGLNYINLSSVQALKRTLEAGIRKVNGATLGQLRTQLFVETFHTLLIAVLITLVLFVLAFGKFQEIALKSFSVSDVLQPWLLLAFVLTFLSVWLLSSLIPALYYSRLNRSLIMARNVFVGKGEWLRRLFVLMQYGISIVLIVGSIVFYRQLNYVQSKYLGFTKEKLITLDINSGAARSNFKGIVNRLKESPDVINASTSSRVPGEWKSVPQVKLLQQKGDDGVQATHYAADQYWLDTYDMQLVQGKGFSGNDASDSLKVILNEKAVDMLGLKDPVGQTLWLQADTISKIQVIGVVKDFHFQSLHEPMSPVVITSWNNPVLVIDYFTIKYAQNTQAVLEHIDAVQKEFDPKNPPEIHFLDDQWERYYRADQSRSSIILIATIISIIISTIGLFGLVNFTAERKTKEIGIRKVLGANIVSIIRLVLNDYLILLLVAMCISAPVAWWLLSDWLSGFAYRINLSPILFILAFVLVLLVSFVTVILRVYRLASHNPINSLRYE